MLRVMWRIDVLDDRFSDMLRSVRIRHWTIPHFMGCLPSSANPARPRRPLADECVAACRENVEERGVRLVVDMPFGGFGGETGRRPGAGLKTDGVLDSALSPSSTAKMVAVDESHLKNRQRRGSRLLKRFGPRARLAESPATRESGDPTRLALVLGWSVLGRAEPPGEKPAEPKLVLDAQGFTSRVNSLAFSPDRQLLAAAGNDKTVRIFHLETGQIQATLRGYDGIGAEGECAAVAFSPSGRELLVGVQSNTTEGAIRVYDVADSRSDRPTPSRARSRRGGSPGLLARRPFPRLGRR